MASDITLYMETLRLAGRIIMENGGETYRVEETIVRMGNAFGLEQVECFAVPSGVFLSFRQPDGTMETSIMRIHRGGTNLNRINAANAVSRRIEKDHLSCEEALQQLKEITRKESPWRQVLTVVAVALSSAGFSAMFGGNVMDCLIGGAAAGLAQLIAILLGSAGHALVLVMIGSFVSALIPELMHTFCALGHPAASIPGALMPLLPGLAMTNAVQDAIRGDMVSATSHAVNAILTAAMVAGGVLVAEAIIPVIAVMGGLAL